FSGFSIEQGDTIKPTVAVDSSSGCTTLCEKIPQMDSCATIDVSYEPKNPRLTRDECAQQCETNPTCTHYVHTSYKCFIKTADSLEAVLQMLQYHSTNECGFLLKRFKDTVQGAAPAAEEVIEHSRVFHDTI
uniref:Apple domain-containing protein n=1 Tax=Romanomermis culicivorax TaxID=13658 RepID=A0A915J5M4_ROMCU